VNVECEIKSDTGNNMGDWTLSKSLLQYLSNISGKHEIKEIQKRTVILVTAHILWKIM
jgi:lauroyl/myristoyl acyltransferase